MADPTREPQTGLAGFASAPCVSHQQLAPAASSSSFAAAVVPSMRIVPPRRSMMRGVPCRMLARPSGRPVWLVRHLGYQPYAAREAAVVVPRAAVVHDGDHQAEQCPLVDLADREAVVSVVAQG